ncbi:NAD-dependent succinate-semialdehyde dehydrogenase [Algoriphagus confluentis]|uniref:NAD-dependent succinate-semialdehyde dehydrogenase n=1 Tax=Algoriphagus confluentis TaxID=1697556 RepID=A0ABQ6PUL9_9BACT|nr:NAD-dependent succinate-semialdehyde dehydrogenase [Algoriphagus confluentis]
MKLIKSINPFTDQILKEFVPVSLEEAKSHLVQAHQAFQEWKETPLEKRASLMKKAGEQLRGKKEHYARLISLEMGKVIRESRAEIDKCAWVCDYYADFAADFLQDEPVALPDGKKAKVIHQPLGVILAVMPWNFPFWQVFRFAAPTLMAGNAGVLKHASNVPQCALAIQEVFEQAGFPKGLFQSLLVSSTVTLSLIMEPQVRAVSLTGSEHAGRAIAAAAGKGLKKTLLELGGSDPFVVFADANLEKAVDTAVKARMINFGQSCIAAKRFLIEQSIYKRFIESFQEKLSQLREGDPLDENADYACMARPDLAVDLFNQVKKSRLLGAKIPFGGEKPEQGSPFFKPTLITDIPKNSPAFQEEMFGPVASFFSFESEQEAVQIANATDFGLGASVWTKDPSRAERMSQLIESGAVFINSMVASHPWLPFGGIKNSGYGRELSRQGILEFVNSKTVYLG